MFYIKVVFSASAAAIAAQSAVASCNGMIGGAFGDYIEVINNYGNDITYCNPLTVLSYS